jgi:hypothetical protein
MSRICIPALTLALCASLGLPSVSAAGDFGPFVEALGGLGVPTLQETGGSANLGAGASAGLAVGVPASEDLAMEFVTVLYASGVVSDSNSIDGALSKEWSLNTTLLGVRYDLFAPVPDLTLGLAAGLGITRLDIGVVDAAVADQQASAFTYYLACRGAYRLVAGLYVGADLRVLLTPTWRDDDAENVELDSFSTIPLLLQVTAGYELELF